MSFLFKNIKKGEGKYKGKLPLKFFKYGKVGHFVAAKQDNTACEEKSGFGGSWTSASKVVGHEPFQLRTIYSTICKAETSAQCKQ